MKFYYCLVQHDMLGKIYYNRILKAELVSNDLEMNNIYENIYAPLLHSQPRLSTMIFAAPEIDVKKLVDKKEAPF